MAPHPSPLAQPSAWSENVAQRQLGDSILAAQQARNISGFDSKLTLETKALSQSPKTNDLHAISKASNPEEQAVSMDILAPFNPNIKDKRLLAIEPARPVAV